MRIQVVRIQIERAGLTDTRSSALRVAEQHQTLGHHRDGGGHRTPDRVVHARVRAELADHDQPRRRDQQPRHDPKDLVDPAPELRTRQAEPPPLLGELRRWGLERRVVDELLPHADRALDWIVNHGVKDGDGFVEYARTTELGLANQGWKDSFDGITFADGQIAEPPIALAEVQGYAYDAKRRIAELARGPWREPELAERLEREAAALQDRLDAAYWLDRRGGYYALALDGGKQPVDALCSNLGHLLWSGIVPEHRVEAVVGALLGDELWTGWGMRTMAAGDAAYDPLGYHTGTVWPHDNSLIAWGLMRYARWPEAQRIVQRTRPCLVRRHPVRAHASLRKRGDLIRQLARGSERLPRIPHPVDQAHRDVELAAHPAGPGAHDPVGRVGELEPTQQVVGTRAQLGPVEAEQAAVQGPVLAPRGRGV